MLASEESTLFRPLRGIWFWVAVGLALAGVLLALNHIFNLRLGLDLFVPEQITGPLGLPAKLGFRLGPDIAIFEPSYLYLLLGLFLSLSFLFYPASRKAAAGVQWYDVALALLTLGLTTAFSLKAPDILAEGWEYKAPGYALAGAALLILLILESVRRVTGLLFTVVVIVCATYPVWAGFEFLPIRGFFLSWQDTVRFHVFSIQSIFGLTAQVIGSLLIGFIVFGIALYYTGAGLFFVNLTMALLGHVRGGTAKVAIAASGLFGMMSGSGVSNVLSTGTITIPAMKRTGFSSDMAAAIEANAACHGAMTPPVMGATAFIMAVILGVSYAEIALAAAVPAFLFYYGMFCQIDGYAAKKGLRGLPRDELPSLRATLKQGWLYVFAIFLLIFLLVYLRREAHAPWLATAALLVLAQLRKETRWNWRRTGEFAYGVGRLVAALVPLFAGIGMLVGALYVTGTAGSLTSDLIHLAGGNVFVLLVFGSIASFVLGTGLPASAAYIFLAIMMAPTLIQQGFNPMAVHLFLLYWANLADVTPPTAVSVVAASGVANSPLMQTMWAATKVAAVKYVEPFMFVIAPARILQSNDMVETVVIIGTALVGIAIVGYAMQAYLPWVGAIKGTSLGRALQVVLIAGGFLIAYPDNLVTGIGVVITGVPYLFLWLAGRNGVSTVVDRPPSALAPTAVMEPVAGDLRVAPSAPADP